VHRRSKDKVAAELEGLAAETSSSSQLLKHEINKAPYGLSRSAALRLLSLSETVLDAAIEVLQDEGLLRHQDGRGAFLTLPENLSRIAGSAQRALAVHHAAHPLRRRGLSLAEIAQAISHTVKVPTGALQAALTVALEAGQLKLVEETYALPSHAPKINAREEQAAGSIAAALEASLAPEQPEDLAPALNLTKERLRHVVDYLLEERLAVLAPGGVFFGARQTEIARAKVRENLATQPGITVSEFNALLGTTRKYGIPLLQLFENEGMLVRDGDVRRLKAKG
jgi:selenocysteine-specific elongation factor